MSLHWSRLVQIQERIPIAELGVSLDTPLSSLALVGESPLAMANPRLRRWYIISPDQFLYVSHASPESVCFAGFAWAPSQAAFASVVTGDIFFDDKASAIPPKDLLPDGKSYDWPSIARFGKESQDSHFHNDLFETGREIYFRRFHYFYRPCTTELHEPPFCIRVEPTDGPWFE